MANKCLYRNPEDHELFQQRPEADAIRDRERRSYGQLARAQETPEEAQERMQREFEERAARVKANKKGCNASKILRGDQIVKEPYIGSLETNRGGDTNRCQWGVML